MTITLNPADYAITPAKRYQAYCSPFADAVWYVLDNWTKRHMGQYTTKEQAQARARTLNSRNGGK